MIPHREVLDLRGEWQLRADVIEKDYVLGWLLAAIEVQPELGATWIFKGGTCLRKCYFETYRFSEDLDFTVIDDGPEDPSELQQLFAVAGGWLYDRAGLAIEVGGDTFARKRNLRGNPTTQGRIAVVGPSRPPSIPKVKIDLTSDETVVDLPQLRPISHPYSDGPLPAKGVRSYSIVDLFAEKLRALSERCRPRDLYDVVSIYRHPEVVERTSAVLAALDQKCAHAGIAVPDADSIQRSPFRDEIEQEWSNMLAHQLPHLPPFVEYWDEAAEVFDWLHGARSKPSLPKATLGAVDTSWVPPREMASWQAGTPLELIRFAGANRLRVEIDYRAESGRRGPRVVEPYSLRMTMDGHLVLFAVDEAGRLRSYRVDRIAGVRVLDDTFQPRYLVEF